jgi:DNA-binding CsgD family transcriptional regulator
MEPSTLAGTTEALATIDLLYRAAIEPELWPQALQALAHACGGIGTAMIPITPNNTAGLVVSPELREPNVEYEREWWRHDSRVLRIHSRGLSSGVCCEAELFTDDEIKRDPLRQEFLRSYGIGAFAAQLVTPLPDFVVAFSVQRAVKRGQFEKGELDMLDLLGRHAARALVISTRLSAGRQLVPTLDAMLERFDCGALVVDRDLKVLLHNEAAQRAMGDGLSVRKGQLRATSRAHQGVLVRLLHAVLSRGRDPASAEAVALPRRTGRRPLLVQAIPISTAPRHWPIPDGAVALLIVVDPEPRSPYSAIRELRVLGLAPSEARIAALIGAGCSRAEAAAALGISASTVHDAVKQIYAKLDISRQAELVRLLDRLAVLEPRGKTSSRRVT